MLPRKAFLILIIPMFLISFSGCALAKNPESIQGIKGKFVIDSLRTLEKPWGIYIWENGKIRKFKRAVSPLWSNDGKKIACVIDSAITVFDTQGDLVKTFPETKDAVRIAWSPDNEKFAYATRFDKLYLFDIKTRTRKKLVDYNNEFSITQVRYSPKGDNILYYKSYVNDFKKCGVYVYDLESSLTKLISAQGTEPAWFPDGKHIGVTTNRNEDWSMINKKLGVFMKINIETGEKTVLREVASFIKDIKVSKDGKYFYYSKPVSKGGYVIVVSPIDKPDVEIPITTPVDLGRGQGYSQDLKPDWYQGG